LEVVRSGYASENELTDVARGVMLLKEVMLEGGC
jgi:hypothetical protein